MFSTLLKTDAFFLIVQMTYLENMRQSVNKIYLKTATSNCHRMTEIFKHTIHISQDPRDLQMAPDIPGVPSLYV